MRRGVPGATTPIHGRAPARPVAAVLISIATFALLLGPAPAPAAASPVSAAAVCTGWTSQIVPPDTIRVLRTRGPAEDTVQVVPFRMYVDVVMAAEWGATNPREALRAGAVAIKEYAWYNAMRWRGKKGPDGQCYDVVDSTIDQLYAPEDRDPAATLVAAVDASWDTVVHRDGRVFSTHYQGGKDVACGSDADGTWLYQRSAMRCARDGKTADEILLLYYGPDAEVVHGGNGPGPGPSPTPTPPVPLALRGPDPVPRRRARRYDHRMGRGSAADHDARADDGRHGRGRADAADRELARRRNVDGPSGRSRRTPAGSPPSTIARSPTAGIARCSTRPPTCPALRASRPAWSSASGSRSRPTAPAARRRSIGAPRSRSRSSSGPHGPTSRRAG